MENPTCGIVMPISSIEDCDEQHWLDVKSIISDAIRDAGHNPQLVSNAVEVNVIQARIVQNLYQNPIVVCDVSCKNANVMFELGLRLAFDKPTIVIKDDKTGYSFDTSVIEHLTYPRSLSYAAINEFKKELTSKIVGTMAAKERDADFSPFLKSFGPLKSVKIESKQVPAQEMIIEMMQSLSNKIDGLYVNIVRKEDPISYDINAPFFNKVIFKRLNEEDKSNAAAIVEEYSKELNISFEDYMGGTIGTLTGRPLTRDDKRFANRLMNTVNSISVK